MGRPLEPLRLDVVGYRLLRGHRPVRLERQPMELLILLAKRRGELVTREEIAARVWGANVFVDVEQSINRIVRKLRTALRDDADRPRFIETVVGQGYRLIGPLDVSTRSLAVLPFANLSGDPSQDYLADVTTEELITRLGNIAGLRVISRTSVNRFRNTERVLPDIARELDVDAFVEGSVAWNNGRVRITAKLVQPWPERPLWGGTFDTDLQDLLATQADITEAIAAHAGLGNRRQQREPVSPRVAPAALGRVPPRPILLDSQDRG